MMAGDPGDRLASPYPPRVVKLTDEQLDSRLTWTRLPNDGRAGEIGASIIHIVPEGSSTVTVVNPVDTDAEGYRVAPWPQYTRPRPAGRKGC